MRKYLSIAFVTLSCLFLQAGNQINDQKKSNHIVAEIILTNGDKFQAVIDMPKIKDKEIYYTDPVTDKRRQMESSEIKYMIVWHNRFPDVQYLFIYTLIKEYNYNVKKEKLAKRPIWLLLDDQREHIRMFRSGDEYKFSKKDGTLRVIAKGYHGQPSAPLYYLQQSHEEIPTEVGTFDYAENFMKLYGKMYFKDNPEMLKTIDTRVLRNKKMSDVLDYYEMTITSSDN